MKKYILSLLLASVSFAGAASISIGKGFGSGVNVFLSLESGGAVSKDFSFAIGTFAADPAANASYTEILAAFKEFGRTSSPLVNGADTIIAVANPITNAPSNAADFNGKPIYIVVATNGLQNTATTQYAVIKAENPAAGKWVFPANVAIADAGDAPMNSAANFVAVVGTEIDNATGVDSLRLVGVPEPTGAALLVSAMGLVAFRRRR